MKKHLFYTMSIGMMMTLLSSCGNGEGTAENTDTTAAHAAKPAKDISEMTWEEKQQLLNADCSDPNDCDEAQCEYTSARVHMLSSSAFSDGIAAYYGSKPVPPGKKVPVSQIRPLVEPACDQYRIQYDLGHDSSTHSEIEFRIVKGYKRPAGETNSYSVAMFKGILNLTPVADTFHLFRGIGGQQGNVVSLYILATSGADTVYMGDFSDTFPL